MKRAVWVLLIAVLLFVAIAFGYRWQWLSEARAQCSAAEPLIAVRASEEQIVRSIGKPSGAALSRGDWGEIHREFAGPKEADIQERLPQGGSVLVYSKSNSIMFVYLDADGKARDVRCFLQ
jgi:hypothetical protein